MFPPVLITYYIILFVRNAPSHWRHFEAMEDRTSWKSFIQWNHRWSSTCFKK